MKKTCEAIEGDIAGFGDDYIVVTPNFAEIYRGGSDSGSSFEWGLFLFFFQSKPLYRMWLF